MIIPDSALPYIRLQRTAYGKRDVREAYAEDMFAEFGMLAPYLPARCAALLDIGCGVAGIDVHLWRSYMEQLPMVYLLDRSENDPHRWYGFRQTGAFYNNLDATSEMMTANGVRPFRVLRATQHFEIAVPRKVDLVLSLYSWGYHYPVSTYLEAVRRVLAPRATVIVDVREGTDGVRVLGALGRVEVVRHFNKSARCVVRKEG